MNKDDELGPVARFIVNAIFGGIPIGIILLLTYVIGGAVASDHLRKEAVQHHVAEYYLKPDHKVGWRWIK